MRFEDMKEELILALEKPGSRGWVYVKVSEAGLEAISLPCTFIAEGANSASRVLFANQL